VRQITGSSPGDDENIGFRRNDEMGMPSVRQITGSSPGDDDLPPIRHPDASQDPASGACKVKLDSGFRRNDERMKRVPSLVILTQVRIQLRVPAK
jgi:hypothetical protein